MSYQVQVKQVGSQTTAVLRLRAGPSELARVVPAACGEVWTFIRSSGFLHGGCHLAVYLDCEGNIEVGAEVDQPFTGNGRFACSTTPAGTVATAVHMGPYHRLGEAHAAVREWCAQNGHALSGTCWEVYDHGTDDPARVRTDVFYLLKP